MDTNKTENKDKGAFPCLDSDYLQEGLTKREYFAAKAMQGLMVQSIPGSHNSDENGHNQYRAKFAVNMADALLKELNK